MSALDCLLPEFLLDGINNVFKPKLVKFFGIFRKKNKQKTILVYITIKSFISIKHRWKIFNVILNIGTELGCAEEKEILLGT